MTVFQKLTLCFKTKHCSPLVRVSDEIMIVSTVNRRKNMPACFLRHTISNENSAFFTTKSLSGDRRFYLHVRK